jgi:Domain of unknown function (DUF4349)
MEPLRDDQLIADLRALRPSPRPQFAAELDERAAAGFPRRSRLPRLSFSRLHALPVRQQLIGAASVAILVIGAAALLGVVNRNDSHPQSSGSFLSLESEDFSEMEGSSETPATATAEAGSVENGSSAQEAEAAPVSPSANARSFSHRDVERSASLTLAADPADIPDDAAAVFEVVHAHRGIVLSSVTKQGAAGTAEANFELLIPSARLGDALGDLSGVDEVLSRHDSTVDITAPTVGAAELLRDSRARIDSLLAQLEGAELESEREAVEVELRHERRHAARLAAKLNRLNRRADLSPVSVLIMTGEREADPGPWGIDDAFHDAGRILAVAAAGLVVALAILGPLALIAFLAWLIRRAWVRRERRRVLS